MNYNVKQIPLNLDECIEFSSKLEQHDIVKGKHSKAVMNSEREYKLWVNEKFTGLIAVNLFRAVVFILKTDKEIEEYLKKDKYEHNNTTLIKHKKIAIW